MELFIKMLHQGDIEGIKSWIESGNIVPKGSSNIALFKHNMEVFEIVSMFDTDINLTYFLESRDHIAVSMILKLFECNISRKVLEYHIKQRSYDIAIVILENILYPGKYERLLRVLNSSIATEASKGVREIASDLDYEVI